jgi:transposase
MLLSIPTGDHHVEMENKVPGFHPLFADFMASIAVAPRGSRASTPQTKGKIERSVGLFKHSYWAGVFFTDLDDLNIATYSKAYARPSPGVISS